MRTRRDDLFTTVKTEGGLLPPDVLARIVAGDAKLEGLTPEAYHLAGGERLNEAVNRSWTRVLAAWSDFNSRIAHLPESDPATTVVRERWLLPLFAELGYGRLQAASLGEIGGKRFALSHLWQRTPIHLVGARVDLDRRSEGVKGAARTSPHGLVQDLLNSSDDFLWGLVSNGLRLRLLRDSASLTRQAYVEFDLKSMLDGEVYSDFTLLWLLAHQSRVELRESASATATADDDAAGDEEAEVAPASGASLAECWLERWSRLAQEQGTRALETLRKGVESAITVLGRGFLEGARNQPLREALRSGDLGAQDYYRQLLRLVYRLLFLFVAEDRDLLHAPGASAEAKERQRRWYSTVRLRRLAGSHRGGPHPDLWETLRLVMQKLESDAGCAELALAALGSFLWSPSAIPTLSEAGISNRALLDALRALAFDTRDGALRPVDFRNLGAEELGSVYESLLELEPRIELDAASFDLVTVGGSERKTTGSYYTPSSLIQSLLETALDPVLAEAAAKPDAERAILALKVVDPACGSGHFLIAAAHRIAHRLACVRTGDDEPSPAATRTALRDVIGRCIYGVDANPMAVELCKVSLWMEALEPGKPLSFLDHRIVNGNSLLGTTPALLAAGVPDDAFKPIEGDDKKVVSALRKQNRAEREGQSSMLTDFAAESAPSYGNLGDRLAGIDAIADDSLDGIRRKEAAFRAVSGSEEFARAKLVADAWCAAFVWRRVPGGLEAVTHDVLERLRRDPSRVPAATRDEIERLARRYGFFHWHVAFPDVFRAPGDGAGAGDAAMGWRGGFDVVLGNPPWEHTELKEREWFAHCRPDIAAAPTGAERKRLIAALEHEDPSLYRAYLDDLRLADGVSHVAREAGQYPLCGRGRINTYAIFAELMKSIVAATGRVGCIVPSGIATDDTTKYFFQDLMDSRSLASLYDFENREAIFPGVHRSYKFCLLTLSGSARPVGAGAEFVFFAHRTVDLRDAERRFALSADDIALLNPNTRTCPVFRSRRDAEITKAIYRRVPVLVREGPPEENPWGVTFRQGLFNMTSDSGLFCTREQLERAGWELDGNVFRKDGDAYLPLYEAKMVHHFDHRFGDYADQPPGAQGTALPDVPLERLQSPDYVVLPRYWVPEREVEERLADKWHRGWLLGWRDICRNTDERTVIASIMPRVGVGNNFPLMFMADAEPISVAALVANLSGFALDYAARFKVGGTHLNFFVYEQLPVMPPTAYAKSAPWHAGIPIEAWVQPRVLELTYTGHDLASFASDCGYDGPPYRWDEERRVHLRCELDAAFFHLYGIARDDVDYILETFPIVKRKDVKRHGEYRTKLAILRIYDAMQEAIDTGEPYRSTLDPPEQAQLPNSDRRGARA